MKLGGWYVEEVIREVEEFWNVRWVELYLIMY